MLAAQQSLLAATLGSVVRRAQVEDAVVVAGLLTELGYPVAAEEVERRLAALGADDRVFVADDGAGMIGLHRIPLVAEGGAFARITALVVHPASRGRGVAGALLRATEEVARHWGCNLIEVSSGRRPERGPAHQFYSAAGFTDSSSRAIRYWKSLGDGAK